jgi:hypothetical protein
MESRRSTRAAIAMVFLLVVVALCAMALLAYSAESSPAVALSVKEAHHHCA